MSAAGGATLSTSKCVSLIPMPRCVVAVVTCRQMPEPDPDQELLLSALRSNGIDVQLVAWDEPGVAWTDFDLAVIRSTWNYIQYLPDFLQWAHQTEQQTRLLNPARIVSSNADKRYLIDLAKSDVPTVPTTYWPSRSDVNLNDVMSQHDWTDVVVKPAVGAGSFLTERFTLADLDRGERFWSRAVGQRAMLVQPYLASVAEYGERCLVWIDGEFTHAVRKEPRMGDAEESVSAALAIAPEEQRLAERVLASTASDLLYGRVDLIRGSTGAPLVAEVELVEPSLFLRQSPSALSRLVDAISVRS